MGWKCSDRTLADPFGHRNLFGNLSRCATLKDGCLALGEKCAWISPLACLDQERND